MSETDETLPPSLAAVPNIPWESQTLRELELERGYWAERVRTAPGFASAKAADDFRRGCEAWIERRRSAPLTPRQDTEERDG